MEDLSGAALNAELDAAEVAGGLPIDTYDKARTLWSEGDAAEDVLILLDGRVRFSTVTPFGAFDALRLSGPAIVGLSEIAAGTPRQTRLDSEGAATIVRMPIATAKELLTDPSSAAAAFRRLGLLSAVRAIRAINLAIKNFFDDVATRDEE